MCVESVCRSTHLGFAGDNKGWNIALGEIIDKLDEGFIKVAE